MAAGRNASSWTELFTKRRGKRNVRRKTPSAFKRWGLLRHVVAKVPGFLVVLEVLVAHTLHFLVHAMIVLGVALEFRGGFSGTKAVGPLAAKAVALQLGAVAYDASLGFLQTLCTVVRLLGLPSLDDKSMVVLRRIALLHSASASLLHCSAVVRWRSRPSERGVPPLFHLLAYFAAPWCGVSVWLVTLQPGDGLIGGTALLDVAALAPIFALRAVLFGTHGLPRVPRAPRSVALRAFDALVLFAIAAAFDALLLRCAWLERRRNWKYVLCAANLAWPWPLLPGIVRFFRQEGRKSRGGAPHSALGGAAHVRESPPQSRQHGAAATLAKLSAQRKQMRRRAAAAAAGPPSAGWQAAPAALGTPATEDSAQGDTPATQLQLPVLRPESREPAAEPAAPAAHSGGGS